MAATVAFLGGVYFPKFIVRFFGISEDMIRLIFQGTPMINDKTLAEYGVMESSVIHIIMQLRSWTSW